MKNELKSFGPLDRSIGTAHLPLPGLSATFIRSELSRKQSFAASLRDSSILRFDENYLRSLRVVPPESEFPALQLSESTSSLFTHREIAAAHCCKPGIFLGIMRAPSPPSSENSGKNSCHATREPVVPMSPSLIVSARSDYH